MVSSWLSGNKRVKNTLLCAALSTGLLAGCTTLQSKASPQAPYGVDVTNRTLAQRLLDRSIENTIKVNINQIDPTLNKRSRIDVDSFYSTVLLTGEVPDANAKQQIETIVSSMPDVKQYHNRLNVTNQKGASYTVHDGYITSKIKAKILANNAIKSSQVKVVTDDGVVYIMGKATPAQRGHLINIVNNTVGIKELVLLTELIDENGAAIQESSIMQETGLEPPAAIYSGESPNSSSYSAPVQQNPTAQSQSPYSPPQNSTQGSPNSSTQRVVPIEGQSPYTQSSQRQVQPNTGQQVPANAKPGSYNSPYIEMYKDEVQGW